MEGFMSNLSKSSGLLLVIVGAGVFILVAFFVFLPMLRSPTDTKPITEMDAKVKKMEAKLTEMEQNYQKVAQLALQQDKLDQVSARLEKLGASTTQRLDQMTREIETFHKQTVPLKTDSAPKQPPAPKTESVSPSKPVETPEKKTSTEKYHEVKPKETLFGIGRIYGLTVDELRRLNNMGPTEMVRSGQKLKVSK
jgi:LysM repeat protein